MSGIYIPGMEMPKSCHDCGIEQEGFWCGVADGYKDTTCFSNERREDCPLVFVPDHGRLVDVDEVCNRLLTLWDTADKEKKVLVSAILADIVAPIIVGTPTIIPADKEAPD